MTEYREYPVERRQRVSYRRESDRELLQFQNCPKYVEHELTSKQIELIVKEVYKQMKIDAFDEGKSAITRILVITGIIAAGLYTFLTNYLNKG